MIKPVRFNPQGDNHTNHTKKPSAHTCTKQPPVDNYTKKPPVDNHTNNPPINIIENPLWIYIK